jgi:hypothetical protein
MPRRVLERRGVTYGITLTNKRAPMADQPEVLLRRFSFLQKGHDGARYTAAQRLGLVTPGPNVFTNPGPDSIRIKLGISIW